MNKREWNECLEWEDNGNVERNINIESLISYVC